MMGWKHPDEFLKLQRLKQKQKALQARITRPSSSTEGPQKEQNASSLPAKRRNPFAR